MEVIVSVLNIFLNIFVVNRRKKRFFVNFPLLINRNKLIKSILY